MNRFLIALSALLLTSLLAQAWDYEGHRVVNQLGLASLPTNFPAFVRTPEAAERIAFLAGEPDRWRNSPDLSLKHCNGPDHYIDLDELAEYDIKPADLPDTTREAMTKSLVELYVNDPSGPVHMACGYALRQWQVGPRVGSRTCHRPRRGGGADRRLQGVLRLHGKGDRGRTVVLSD